MDFENGQKTGFFLDQKYNRLAVAKLAKGKTVLDCFTHTGSFALNAAKGGAKHVTAVDVSQFAVDCAAENARKNGLDGVMDCVCANVFDLLPQLAEQPGVCADNAVFYGRHLADVLHAAADEHDKRGTHRHHDEPHAFEL